MIEHVPHFNVIREHMFRALKELGFRRRWITLQSSRAERRVSIADGTIDGIAIRLYLLIFSGAVTRWTLYQTYELIEEGWNLIEERRIDGMVAHVFTIVSAGTETQVGAFPLVTYRYCGMCRKRPPAKSIYDSQDRV